MDDSLEDGEIEIQIRTVARRIREERQKLRLSQIDLSFRAGLSQNQVFCIETGKRIPNLYTLLRICSALGLSPAELFSPPEEEKAKAKNTVLELVTRYM